MQTSLELGRKKNKKKNKTMIYTNIIKGNLRGRTKLKLLLTIHIKKEKKKGGVLKITNKSFKFCYCNLVKSTTGIVFF